MERPEIAQFTTLDFQGWNETGALILTPKFQRREVWKTPARSYFIDSLLKGVPIPPILLRLSQSDDKKKIVREVVDGQQRLRAVLDFISGNYALTKTLDNPNAGRRFDALNEDDKDRIRKFSFLCEIFKSISDQDVLDVFARVNTYAVGLNSQELRNGKYFGFFKQSSYALAIEHLEFWRQRGIFTEGAIARMLEVELTSELMIALLAGQQDKKKSIDRFYAEFDEVFPARKKVESRFRAVIDSISEAVSDSLADTEFRRVPLFYTLWCVVAHRLFGIPGEQLPTEARGRLSKEEGQALRDAAVRLSDKIVAFKEGRELPAKDAAFLSACLRQTDNIKPRQTRFGRLYREAF